MPYLFYYHCRQTVFISLLLICLSIGCGIAYAAVVVDNTSTVFNQNPDTLTVSHTTSGIDRLMIVGVSMLNNRSEVVTSVTYGGAALNRLGAVEQSNDSRVELWSYVNPPITTADVIVNFDQRVQDGAGFGVITFTGVDPGSPFGSFQSQTGQSSTASINVTSATGEVVLGVMVAKEQDNSPSTAAGTPRWSYKVQNGNNKTVGAGATADGAANTTLTWGLNESDNWAVGAISIRPSITPLLEYYFDELSWDGTAGEVIDSSGNNNNGTAQSSLTTSNSAPAIAGTTGTCSYGEFNGSNHYVALGNPASLNFAGAITMAAWIRPDTSSGLRNIIAHGYRRSPNQEMIFRINNGNYQVGSWNGSGHTASAAIPAGDVGTGNWVHLAGTYDGSTWRLYRNGVEVSDNTDPVGAIEVSENWAIGARGTGTERFFDGGIDEPRIYSQALTAAQISTLMNETRTCPDPAVLEMDVGQVDLPDTSVSSNFTTVNFATGFTVAPLVFTLPTLDGSDPAALRIRNVTTSSFDIAYVEPNSENGTHPGGKVDWFAITPGDHTLPDGTRLLARTIDTMRFQTRTVGGASWEDITFAPAFAATPAVVGMVQTMNNESGSPPGSSSIPWLTTAIRNVDRSSMDLALERAESSSGTVSVDETVAYLAMDAGVQGTFPNGLDYETLISADRIRGINSCENTLFQGSYTGIPLVIASQNRRDGGDGGWIRRCFLDNTRVGLVIDEDQDRDNERNHTTESAGILVISSPNLFPNPLLDYHFDELSWDGTAGEVGDSSGNGNNGVAVGGITTVAGKICNAADIPRNTSAANYEAVDTGLDLDSDIGSVGTISLWYKSNVAWNAGPDRRLFAANDGSKYFFAEVASNGRVKFWFEDGSDGDYQKTTVNAFVVAAEVWKHLTFAWDVSSRTAKIYVDGIEQTLTGGTGNTSAFNGFDTLYFGDNRDASYITGQSSADGLIDEALIFDSVLTSTQIQTIYSNQDNGNNYDGTARTCPVALIDHFAISHDTTAINCLAENITIDAHIANHDIDTTYTGTITLSTDTDNGDWSWVSGGLASNLTNSGNGAATFVFDGSEDGTVVLALSNTEAETVNINVTDGSFSETTGTALASEDPDLVFDAAGFRFVEKGTGNAIGLQISGKPSNAGYGAQNLILQAINTNADTGVCEAALTDTATVEFRLECDNPATCDRPLYLGATTPSEAITTTGSASLNFDYGQANEQDNGADFVINYPDSGAVILRASHTLPNGTVMVGNTDPIVWRPFGFDLQAVYYPDLPALTNPVLNPAATGPGDDIFISAGTPFTVTATAALWNSDDDDTVDGIPDGHDDGDPTNNADLSGNAVTLDGNIYTGVPNFGQESEALVLAAELNQPTGAGVNNPALSGSSIATFTGGAGLNNDVIYREVGIIELNATIDDDNYLGIGNAETIKMLSKSGFVGRFIPASFEVAITNPGSFDNTCNTGATPFTYIGKDFGYLLSPTFSVTAKNAFSVTTNNYRDGFVKLGPTSITLDPVTVSSNLGSDAAVLAVTRSVAAMTQLPDNNGAVNYTLGADRYRYGPDPTLLEFSKASNSEVTPFTADIDPVISFVDDGEVSNTVSKAINIVGNAQRFGRLKMSNVHGSELTDLEMPMIVEYLSLAGYVINVDDDNCTNIVDSDLTVTPTGLSTVTVTNPDSVAGDLGVTLSAPGAAVVGSIVVSPNLNTSIDKWLRYNWDGGTNFDLDPSATATFGIYKGNEVNIYIQQTFQ